MANLSDYHVIDGVTEVLAEHHNTVLDSTIRAELSNIETLAADRTLVDDDFALQVFTPTAARDVLLPAVAVTNHPFYIINASATYALSVKNAGGTLIGTVDVSGSGQFSSDGASWFITSMPYVLPSTSGNVLKSDGTNWLSSSPLDEYTSFTPVVYGTTTRGTGTYTTQNAYYSKIGKVVHFALTCAWSAHDGTGNIRIDGLPYTSSNNVFIFPLSVYWSGVTLAAVGNKLLARIVGGQAYIDFLEIASAGPTAIPMDTAGTIAVEGFYFVA